MSWSTDFINSLALGSRGLRYILRVIEVDGVPGTAYALASHAGIGDAVGLSTQGVSEVGATVSLRGATTTIGAFNLTLVGDLSGFLAHVSRGTIVGLEVGFPGWDEADFQQVALGVVRNLRSRGGPATTLEVWDLFAAFRQRADLAYGLNLLGDPTNTELVTTTDFTPGDTTLKVADVAGFYRETGGTGLLRITPLSGDPFYVTWTGTSGGDTFTGVVDDVLGTTAVLAEAGSLVEGCLYVPGHPLDAVRKLCLSTGAGTNGTYDTLPGPWGIGIPDDFWDHTDTDDTKGVMGAFAPYPWHIVLMGSTDNALSWMQGLLSRAGLVITMHQGKLTIRAIQDPQLATVVMDLTDADIIRVDDWECWDPTHAVEYAYVQALYDGDTTRAGSAANTITTLPAANSANGGPGMFDINLGDLVFAGTNATDVCDETIERMEPSLRRVPEKVRLRTVLRTAVLTPCDVVTLTTRQCQSRAGGAAGFTGQRAVVSLVARDWSSGTVMLELRIYAEDES